MIYLKKLAYTYKRLNSQICEEFSHLSERFVHGQISESFPIAIVTSEFI